MSRYHVPSGKQFAHLPAPLAGALDDRAAWVVGAIIRLQGTLRYTSAAPRDEYVPLAVRPFLKPALGAYYPDVIQSLLREGVIEGDDDSYRGDPVRVTSESEDTSVSVSPDESEDVSPCLSLCDVSLNGGGAGALLLGASCPHALTHFHEFRGGKAQCYRLTARYRDQPTARVELRRPQLLANLARLRARRRRTTFPPVSIQSVIRRWVETARVSAEYQLGTCPIVDDIVEGRWYFEQQGPGGRLHHNLTAVPGPPKTKDRKTPNLWPLVAVAGRDDLVLVDVPASQPVLAGVEILHGIRALVSRGAGPCPLVRSAAAWLGLACGRGAAGDLYLDVMAAAGLADRDVAKKRVMAVLYGGLLKGGGTYDTGTRAGLAIDRPCGPEVRGEFLRRNRLARGQFPRRMQWLEAQLVIHRAATELSDAHPEEPVVSLHDALLCPAGLADEARRRVRAAFEAYEPLADIAPRVEPWSI